MSHFPAIPVIRAAAQDGDLLTAIESDGPAVEQVASSFESKVEDAGPLLEEGPFLRKEERKTGQVDLLIIGFNLRKISIDGNIQGQVVGDPVFGIQSGRQDGTVCYLVGRRLPHSIDNPAESLARAKGAI